MSLRHASVVLALLLNSTVWCDRVAAHDDATNAPAAEARTDLSRGSHAAPTPEGARPAAPRPRLGIGGPLTLSIVGGTLLAGGAVGVGLGYALAHDYEAGLTGTGESLLWSSVLITAVGAGLTVAGLYLLITRLHKRKQIHREMAGLFSRSATTWYARPVLQSTQVGVVAMLHFR